MTLSDWCKASGIVPTHPTTERGAVSLISYSSINPMHADLWHLSDYVVSSVCGIVIWLVPDCGDWNLRTSVIDKERGVIQYEASRRRFCGYGASVTEARRNLDRQLVAAGFPPTPVKS